MDKWKILDEQMAESPVGSEPPLGDVAMAHSPRFPSVSVSTLSGQPPLHADRIISESVIDNGLTATVRSL